MSPFLDFSVWAACGGIVALLLCSAYLSASEVAMTAASRAKLRTLADRGDWRAANALTLTEDREKLIGSIILANTIVNILAASLATALAFRAYGFSGVTFATLVMTALVLIFAEVMPRTYAKSAPEDVARSVARPIGSILPVLSPVVSVVRAVVRAFLGLVGQRIDPDTQMFSVHDEIAGALSIGHAAGAVQEEDRDRLLGALDLGDRTVEEIMLHRSEIEMIDADLPAAAVIEAVLASPHTRLPVYKDERENVVGVVHAKDLLRSVNRMFRNADGDQPLRDFDIMSVAMKPYFVPETTALDEQMQEFLARHVHFALVVDEYGSLRGLITLEDILEEIVGEIEDEHDTEADETLTPNAQGDYTIGGGMTIRDLNRALDWSLPDDEANTVAGLVIHMAQSIPEPGQIFSFHGYRFEVVARRENRITRLRIRPLSRPVSTAANSA